MDQPGMGEQMLSKAVEMGLESQLDEVENLEVDIRTDPLKLMQGQVDSVGIEGQGLVMKKDLRTEELKVEVGNVAINPLKVAFGEVELSHPTNASAYVVLTEQDIERAFNTDFIRSKLQHFQLDVDGQPVTINTRHVKFGLPGEGRVALEADVYLPELQEDKKIAFSAVPEVDASGYSVKLNNVHYDEGGELSTEFTAALLKSTGELLDLRNFDLKSMSLRLKQLDVQTGKIKLEGEAYIEQFPG